MKKTGDPNMPYQKIIEIIRKPSTNPTQGWPAAEGEVKGVPFKLIAASTNN
jgi:hypothetical protein